MCPSSQANPLHNIPVSSFLPAVIGPRGVWVGPTGELLHVFEGDALLEQVSDGGDAEGMEALQPAKLTLLLVCEWGRRPS